jgi:hypothetical protein
MDDYENDGFIPDIAESNDNDLYEEGHEVDEYDSDWDNSSEYEDRFYEDPETGDKYFDARTSQRDPDAPQADDFDTYEEYEVAMVDYRVDQKLAATGVQPSGPSPADIARQEAAFDQGISDGLADPSWEKKRELVAEIEQLHERAMTAQADGDMQLTFRLEMQKAETIRELERQPASPLRKQAEQANKQEVFQMWNNAVENPGFLEAESKKSGLRRHCGMSGGW